MNIPALRICRQCGDPFAPKKSRTLDGWTVCCSTLCSRAYRGRIQLVNGSHARACAARRLRCAERMAEKLRNVTKKQAYQMGWKRGYQRGRGLLQQFGRGPQFGETAVQKAGKVIQ